MTIHFSGQKYYHEGHRRPLLLKHLTHHLPQHSACIISQYDHVLWIVNSLSTLIELEIVFSFIHFRAYFNSHVNSHPRVFSFAGPSRDDLTICSIMTLIVAAVSGPAACFRLAVGKADSLSGILPIRPLLLHFSAFPSRMELPRCLGSWQSKWHPPRHAPPSAAVNVPVPLHWCAVWPADSRSGILPTTAGMLSRSYISEQDLTQNFIWFKLGFGGHGTEWTLKVPRGVYACDLVWTFIM